MSRTLVLVLGCDLLDDGNELGPRHISRLRQAAERARIHSHELCVAATFSPAHPAQRNAMSTMSAAWVKQHFPEVTVHDLVGEEKFNSRGEMRKFIRFVDTQEIRPVLGIASAWWHIPRVETLFEQEFGVGQYKIEFFKTDEEFALRMQVLETFKRQHARLPAKLRHRLEYVVRATGFNPSW